jgi:hypothetical protein
MMAAFMSTVGYLEYLTDVVLFIICCLCGVLGCKMVKYAVVRGTCHSPPWHVSQTELWPTAQQSLCNVKQKRRPSSCSSTYATRPFIYFN